MDANSECKTITHYAIMELMLSSRIYRDVCCDVFAEIHSSMTCGKPIYNLFLTQITYLWKRIESDIIIIIIHRRRRRRCSRVCAIGKRCERK